MRYQIVIKTLLAAVFTVTVSHASVAYAHSVDGVLLPEDNTRTFTAKAVISCTSKGNDNADNLVARIRDSSPPVPGLLVNLMIYKERTTKIISITDTVSGDADYSPFIALQAGEGAYHVVVSKTGIGARNFDLDYHCQSRDGVHVETELNVQQYGFPEFLFE